MVSLVLEVLEGLLLLVGANGQRLPECIEKVLGLFTASVIGRYRLARLPSGMCRWRACRLLHGRNGVPVAAIATADPSRSQAPRRSVAVVNRCTAPRGRHCKPSVCGWREGVL